MRVRVRVRPNPNLCQHDCRVVGVDDERSGNLVDEDEEGESQEHEFALGHPIFWQLSSIACRPHAPPSLLAHDPAHKLEATAKLALLPPALMEKVPAAGGDDARDSDGLEHGGGDKGGAYLHDVDEGHEDVDQQCLGQRVRPAPPIGDLALLRAQDHLTDGLAADAVGQARCASAEDGWVHEAKLAGDIAIAWRTKHLVRVRIRGSVQGSGSDSGSG